MSQAIAVVPEVSTEPMMPRPALLRSVRPEAAGIATYTFAFADDGKYSFRPGQFNMLYLPGYGEVAISLASSPENPHEFEHTIRHGGMVTRAIERLQPGACIGIRGPYGTSWPLEAAEGKDIIIAAGGIGLAPLRPAILSMLAHRERYGRLLLLYGARTPQDMLYGREAEDWERQGLEMHVSVDRADQTWRGQVGVVPMVFYRIRPDYKKTLVFACGPEVMMRFVIYESLARRIPKQSIYVSLERNMKCALGFCGHCQYGPFFICKHGPVFKFSAIEPFFGKEDY